MSISTTKYNRKRLTLAHMNGDVCVQAGTQAYDIRVGTEAS